jgi:hypothetical protein
MCRGSSLQGTTRRSSEFFVVNLQTEVLCNASVRRVKCKGKILPRIDHEGTEG